jgi:hypothetical protein
MAGSMPPFNAASISIGVACNMERGIINAPAPNAVFLRKSFLFKMQNLK